MDTFYIRKGRNIKLKGAASKKIVEAPLPAKIAISPADFRGLKLRPEVREGDYVKVGSPLLSDKTHPNVKIVSPVSGKVAALNRGEKRVLLQIVVQPDGKQDALSLRPFLRDELAACPRAAIVEQLLTGGLWPVLRQRPFSKVASPDDIPKSIFVHAMNTEPLALDVDFILSDKKDPFQAGLDVIRLLTKGDVHLCFDAQAQSKALTEAKGVKLHRFSGPHPSGNVSTHIHAIDPIGKGDIVWYLEAQDVLRIAVLFLKGVHCPQRWVAVTGEGVSQRVYKETIIGVPFSSLLETSPSANMCYVSGSILSGTNDGPDGFLRYYDSQITVIPRGGKRELLGWLWPGFRKYSFSKTFVSSFLPQKEVSLDTDIHGSERAIVLNHIYDRYVPLDIMTFFLLRAVIAGEIEEAEKLGILECDEEDFALCSFACPSKIDVGGIIRRGLELIEKEG